MTPVKSIRTGHVLLAFVLQLIFAVCLIAGFLKWVFFILSGASLITYAAIDRKYLRCPCCGGYINLDRLFYARKHVCHCLYCGEVIKVE